MTFVKSLIDSLVLIWVLLIWCVRHVLRWVSMAEGVCCLGLWGGGGEIWLQLSCVTIFTCLTACGLRVEGM